jgi:protoporphyrinogen/coproporphyrinogen III oxidase
MDRRQFIKHASTASLAAGFLGAFSVAQGKVGKPLALPQAFDNIDDFSIMHQLRDGKVFTGNKPSLHKSLVVVGGGISGLTALSRLGDVDAILVDKEPQLGGNSRRRQAHGIHYPLGALVSQGAEAPFTDFLTELAIPFQRVAEPELAYFAGNRLVRRPLDEGAADLPYSARVRRQFAQLRGLFSEFLAPQTGIFFPIEDNTPARKALDKHTLHAWFDQAGLYPEVQHFLNLVISSRLGTHASEVSAWMGLYILSRFVGPNFTLPGGHGVISEALVKQIEQQGPNRLMPGLATVSVEHQGDGKSWVTCVNRAGEPITISADAVIMATPKLISKHLVKGLPQAQVAAMAQYRYSAYLVAQVQLKQVVAPVFETMTDNLFSRFMVRADWPEGNRNPDGRSHLTVYTPFPGPPGRAQLYGANAMDVAQRILDDIERVYPGAKNAVDNIELHRWGHPMVMPEPNISARLAEAIQPFNNVFFAHSDNMGISGLYSAIWSGMDAYTSALLHLEEQSFSEELQ